MLKYLESVAIVIMHRNAAVISVMCILLCLTFNYTFPLLRDKSNSDLYNLSNVCDKSEQYPKIVKQSKKITRNAENPKKIKPDDQACFRHTRFDANKDTFTDEDFRYFEKMVIMKKNPFIDLKQLQLKYSPSDKNTRESLKLDMNPLPQVFINEPGIWEPMEEIPNVEIINRGLSGFALPGKILSANFGEYRWKGNKSDIVMTDLR